MYSEVRGREELHSRYPGFVSHKTFGPIHYPLRWIRDSLIRMSLDTSVTEMWANDLASAVPDIVFSFMVVRRSRPTLVTVSSWPLTFNADETFTEHLPLTRADLHGPSAEAGRDIWSRKKYKVDPSLRLMAIAHVRAGPETSLGSLVEQMGSAFPTALSGVLSMIANGYLQVDISSGLDMDSRIDLGPCAINPGP